jgi:hypothetical protein
MIWLRHELWEHADGLSYRLASRAETDRLAGPHPEGVIKHVFYAPSTAAAVAQFYALRNLGPYIPGEGVSEDGFTLTQLESQLADYPDDTILAGQPALKAKGDAHPTEPAAAADHEPVETHDDHAEPHAETAADPEPEGHAEPVAPVEPAPDAEPTPDAEPVDAHPAAAEAHPVEPLALSPDPVVSTPDPMPPAHDPLDLWPVTPDEVVAPRWARAPRRRANPFVTFLRIVLLLIILAAIAVGLLIVTGTVDGPTLLAQVRDLSIVRSVLPSA